MNEVERFKLVATSNNNMSNMRFVPYPVESTQYWSSNSEIRFFRVVNRIFYYVSNSGEEDELATFTQSELDEFPEELFELFKPVKVN